MNFHLVPDDSFEEMSSDKQVVLKFTNEYDARESLNEIRVPPCMKARVVAILVVSGLPVQSLGLNVCKTVFEL